MMIKPVSSHAVVVTAEKSVCDTWKKVNGQMRIVPHRNSHLLAVKTLYLLVKLINSIRKESSRVMIGVAVVSMLALAGEVSCTYYKKALVEDKPQYGGALEQKLVFQRYGLFLYKQRCRPKGDTRSEYAERNNIDAVNAVQHGVFS